MKRKRRSQCEHSYLENRLTKYALACGAMVASGAAANADIVLFSPNQTSTTNGALYVDMEGTVQTSAFAGNDFKLQHSFTTDRGTISSMTSVITAKEYIARGVGYNNGMFMGGQHALKLNGGSYINGNSFYNNPLLGSEKTHLGSVQTQGNWHAGDIGYLGIKFTMGGQPHYGWAEVFLSPTNYRITLTRFAYETVPNKSIQAAQEFEVLTLDKAVSRKKHGGTDFDINLPLTGAPGVECRVAGQPTPPNPAHEPQGTLFPPNSHILVFTFSNKITSGNAVVTSGTANIAFVSTPGDKTMTVELKDVLNAQKVVVTLKNVTDEHSQVLADTPVSINFLVGDTTASKAVNSSDVAQTKAQSGAALTQANFRTDVTVNGAISASDVSLVKARSGTAIPSGPISAKATGARPATR